MPFGGDADFLTERFGNRRLLPPRSQCLHGETCRVQCSVCSRKGPRHVRGSRQPKSNALSDKKCPALGACADLNQRAENRSAKEATMNSLKPIWLVEDCLLDAELMLATFHQLHLANPVIVLRDGGEVMERLQRLQQMPLSSEPAVIFMDIRMPRVDGIETLRSIKFSDRFRHLPVVMLTSSSEVCDMAKSYE